MFQRNVIRAGNVGKVTRLARIPVQNNDVIRVILHYHYNDKQKRRSAFCYKYSFGISTFLSKIPQRWAFSDMFSPRLRPIWSDLEDCEFSNEMRLHF